jgi:hypothetical protein
MAKLNKYIFRPFLANFTFSLRETEVNSEKNMFVIMSRNQHAGQNQKIR